MKKVYLSLAVSLALIISLLSSNFAAAVSNGGIGGRPANPDPNNPRTNSIFIFTIERGQNKQDEVQIANNSDATQTINVAVVDGVVSNTGSFTCKQNSEQKTSVGAWTHLNARQLTLEPGQKQNVGFSVNVPANADVGEHNGCITFQAAEDEGEVSGNVRVRTRQAIRQVVTVPGDLKKDIEIADFKVNVDGGAQNFNLTLKNNGNVSADVNSQVFLDAILGGNVYKNGGEYPVISDQKLDLSFANNKAPFFGGIYKAYATATYDKRPGVFGASSQENQAKKTSPTQLVFIMPSPVAIILTTAIIGLIIFAIYRLKAKKRK